MKQNVHESEEKMLTAIRSSVDHMFGCHDKCGNWCRASEPGYKHSNLPRGEDLADDELKQIFMNLIDPYLSDPKKFLTDGSSQRNECLNSVAWTKNPKTRSYDKSESFDYRMAAGVCEFNEGHVYVNDIAEKIESPKKETKEYCERQIPKRQYMHEYKSSRAFKKRRKELIKTRGAKDRVSDIKSGLTYQSNCLDNPNHLDTDIIPDHEIPSDKFIEINQNETEVVFLTLKQQDMETRLK